jgi:DNA primase
MNDCESVRKILTDLGYVLTDNGREFRTRPLYRDSDNDNVLRIWKNSGQWVDFKESRSGSLEELVKLTLKLKSIDDAKQWISAKGVVYETEIEKPKALVKQVKYFDKSLLLKLTKNDDYWNSRKISSSTLVVFGGGLATTGKMYNRYTFPIYDYKDNIIGFSGRDVSVLSSEDRPKWKHIGDKKEWVYPLKVNIQDIKKAKHIILVESIGDMLALRENGITNTIVTFGLSVSSKIICSLIALNPQKITIAFNNDSLNNSAGNEAAALSRSKLLNYFDPNQININLPQEAKDFGDLHLLGENKVKEWFRTI